MKKKIKFNHRKLVRDLKRIYRKSKRRPFFVISFILILFFSLFYSPGPTQSPEVLGISSASAHQLERKDILPVKPRRVPQQVADYPLEISAQGAAVYDLNSQTFLYEKNGQETFLPASLTKIVTAHAALKFCSPDQIVEIQNLEINGTQMGLNSGERMSVKNLLLGALLSSGNDAARGLAEGCFGNKIERVLNEEVDFLGLENTHFSGPTGLEEENHFTSPKDLALLAARIYQDPLIQEIVIMQEAIVSSADNAHWHTLKNSNTLLKELPGVVGMKTGWTEEAEECLITVYQNGEQKILIVVLKSEARNEDTKKIIQWVFRSFQW